KPGAEFNVIKFDEEARKISLLLYENFFDNPFPTLQRSYVVDVVSGRVKQLHFDVSKNPPILHRKELLLPSDHPDVPRFAALTQHLKSLGFFKTHVVSVLHGNGMSVCKQLGTRFVTIS